MLMKVSKKKKNLYLHSIKIFSYLNNIIYIHNHNKLLLVTTLMIKFNLKKNIKFNLKTF